MIHYYQNSSKPDFFVEEDNEWYYLDPSSQLCRITQRNLPDDLEKIEWKDVKVIKPEPEAQTLKDEKLMFCGPDFNRNIPFTMKFTYGYESIADLLNDEESEHDPFHNRSWRMDVKLHRSGLIETDVYKNNDFKNVSAHLKQEIPFSQMQDLFNETEMLLNEADKGGIYVDDHYGEVNIFYENSKTVSFSRGLETTEGTDIHGHIRRFLEDHGIKTDYDN